MREIPSSRPSGAVEKGFKGGADGKGTDGGEGSVDEHHQAGAKFMLLGEGGLYDSEEEHCESGSGGGDGEEGMLRWFLQRRREFGEDVDEDGDGTEEVKGKHGHKTLFPCRKVLVVLSGSNETQFVDAHQLDEGLGILGEDCNDRLGVLDGEALLLYIDINHFSNFALAIISKFPFFSLMFPFYKITFRALGQVVSQAHTCVVTFDHSCREKKTKKQKFRFFLLFSGFRIFGFLEIRIFFSSS